MYSHLVFFLFYNYCSSRWFRLVSVPAPKWFGLTVPPRSCRLPVLMKREMGCLDMVNKPRCTCSAAKVIVLRANGYVLEAWVPARRRDGVRWRTGAVRWSEVGGGEMKWGAVRWDEVVWVDPGAKTDDWHDLNCCCGNLRTYLLLRYS